MDSATSNDSWSAVPSGFAGSKLIARALESSVLERNNTELNATSSKQHDADKR